MSHQHLFSLAAKLAMNTLLKKYKPRPYSLYNIKSMSSAIHNINQASTDNVSTVNNTSSSSNMSKSSGSSSMKKELPPPITIVSNILSISFFIIHFYHTVYSYLYTIYRHLRQSPV